MFTNPKRKHSRDEKLDSKSRKRKKVSNNVSERPMGENIPNNEQKKPGIEKLDIAIPIMPCDGILKMSKKKRLNLRTKTAVTSTAGNNDKLTIPTTEAVAEIEKPVPAEKNTLAVNSVEKIDEASGNDSTSSETEQQRTSTKCCPVCEHDFTASNSDAEIHHHINKCLDSGKANLIDTSNERCQLCWKDISKYNSVRRQQHLNKCCDNSEKQNCPVKETSRFSCPICGKFFKTTKTRQTHMKKCAKKNNVSTNQLVELNRRENASNGKNVASSSSISGQDNSKANQNKHSVDALEIFKTNKRKRKAKLPARKNLDDQTQLALALSASMQCENVGVQDCSRKDKKRKKETSELPALLLRSDDEMKKVTEARAAEVLCQWADDDEIQCTPALGPSSLVKKYAKDSSSDAENLDILLSEQVEDIEDMSKDCHSPTIEIRCRPNTKKDETCTCPSGATSFTNIEERNERHGVVNQKYFSVDSQTRLWNLASLRMVTDNDFYVPNLLPKSTPRKEKKTRAKEKESVQSSGENYDNCKDSPSKVGDGDLTASQENDIEELVDLLSDDTASNGEKENEQEIDETWFRSSGFCVRKDTHEAEENDKEEMKTLLNDLSCMVGNPLHSDVDIVAKNNKKFHAHSFMLSARCSTLTEILHASKVRHGDERNSFRLELLDIDVRAVHAVLTYIYTAYFIPVVENIVEDVKKLVHRWNLNCSSDKWKVIRDEDVGDEDNNNGYKENGGGLDVLLESLWDGEEEVVSKESDENVFGNSILDDELGDMQIKIYTQLTPKKTHSEESQKNHPAVEQIDLDSDHVVTNVEKIDDDVVCDGEGKIHLNVTENQIKNEAISKDLGGICFPETPLKLSSLCSSREAVTQKDSAEDEVTLVEEASDSLVGINTCQSIRVEDTSDPEIAEISFRNCHASPNRIVSIGSDNDHSSPIFQDSPSSVIEMMSSPDRSPFADNFDEFCTENANSDTSRPKMSSQQLLGRSSPSTIFTGANENMKIYDVLDIAIVSPESKAANSSLYSTNAENDYAVSKDNVGKTVELSTVQGAVLVNQIASSPVRQNLFQKEADNSLLDLFSSCSDEKAENSSCFNSRDELIVVEENDAKLLNVETDCQPQDKGGGMTQENDNKREKRQSHNIKKQGENCLNYSSAKLKPSVATHVHCVLDDSLPSEDVLNTESKSKQSCTKTKQPEYFLNDSIQSKDATNFEDGSKQSSALVSKSIDCSFDDSQSKHLSNTEHKTKQFSAVTRQIECSLNDPLDSKDAPTTEHSSKQLSTTFASPVDCSMNKSLQPKNASGIQIINVLDDRCDDQVIDCYDEGGFNCDIDDFMNYDTYSEQDNENCGTSSSTAQNTVEACSEETRTISATNNSQKVKKNCQTKVASDENSEQTAENVELKTGRGTMKRKNPKTEAARSKRPEDKAKQSNPSEKLNLREPRTPMLDYSNMATPDLKGELKQFGVRPLAKRKMVIKLKEIYNYTHKKSESDEEDEESKNHSGDELGITSENTNSQQGSTQDSESESSSDSDHTWRDEELFDDPELLSQASSSNLSKTLMSFLTQDHEIYYKILKYMPISVSDVLATIKDNGIKCTAEQLKNFLDEQCIVYSEPRPTRAWRRGRRAKNKS